MLFLNTAQWFRLPQPMYNERYINYFRHLTKDSPGKLGGFCGLCGSGVVLGARIRLIRATGLEKQDRIGGKCCLTC